MQFMLKTPCKNCPFRCDKTRLKGWLGSERAAEIFDNLLAGGLFPCHNTHDYSQDSHDDINEDSANTFVHQDSHQFCAGALILLEKTQQAGMSQAIRMAERLGMYDRNRLDMTAPVFENREDFENWHNRSNG